MSLCDAVMEALMASECLAVMLPTLDLQPTMGGTRLTTTGESRLPTWGELAFQHEMHQAISEGNLYTQAFAPLQMYTDTGQGHII